MLSTFNASATRLPGHSRFDLAAIVSILLAAPLVILSSAVMLRAGEPAPAASSPEAAQKDLVVEFLPPLSPSEQKIMDELEMLTEMQYIETPFQGVVDDLKKRHGIEIQLDAKALEEAGIGSDTPVTRSLRDIPLRSALQLVLDGLDLTYDVSNDVLLITTQEKAGAMLTTRTYPVGDLSDKQDYDALVNAITSTVKPTNWDEVGGAGSLVVVKASKSLVISQTHEAQVEIVQLLRSLRAARKLPDAPSKAK